MGHRTSAMLVEEAISLLFIIALKSKGYSTFGHGARRGAWK